MVWRGPSSSIACEGVQLYTSRVNQDFRSNSDTHTRTFSLSLSLSLSLSHILKLTHRHTYSFSVPLALCLSLSHTHLHTRTLSYTQTHTHILSLSLSLSLSLPQRKGVLGRPRRPYESSSSIWVSAAASVQLKMTIRTDSMEESKNSRRNRCWQIYTESWLFFLLKSDFFLLVWC